MAEKRGPIERRGIAKNLTLDVDAVELLHEMVPSKKGLGRYLSELVRNERVRKEERDKTRLELAQAQVDRFKQPTLCEEAERSGLRAVVDEDRGRD